MKFITDNDATGHIVMDSRIAGKNNSVEDGTMCKHMFLSYFVSLIT